MFVCNECGNLFDESVKCYGEQLEHFGMPCREEYVGSPCCKGAFTEAYECVLCGEFITDDFLKDEDGNRYCESHFIKCKYESE